MYYLRICPCCEQRLLAIRICCQGQAGLVVCDECEATWLDVALQEGPRFPAQPESRCPRCGGALWQSPRHWASATEIDRLGWRAAIVGFRDKKPTAIAHLARIAIFPIKSLDGVSLDEATVLPSGALKHDRQFALRDDQGMFVNGKRTPAVHRLCASLDTESRILNLQRRGDAAWQTFRLDADRAALECWLREFFAFPVRLAEDAEHGFPDDLAAPGPTIISTATLREVASWFPGLALEDVRRRFRANLEIDGVEPFWEDRLYGEPGQGVPFQLGSLLLEGVNPCQRCVVPSRSPEGDEVTAEFAKTFAQRRQETLPAWAARSRFNHFYRLAVNTRPLAVTAETVIRVGDELRLFREAPT